MALIGYIWVSILVAFVLYRVAGIDDIPYSRCHGWVRDFRYYEDFEYDVNRTFAFLLATSCLTSLWVSDLHRAGFVTSIDGHGSLQVPRS